MEIKIAKLYKTHRYSIEALNNTASIIDRTELYKSPNHQKKNKIEIATASIWVDSRKLVHGFNELRQWLSDNNIKPIN